MPSTPVPVARRALRFATSVLRRLRLVGWSVLIGGALAAAGTLVHGPEYTAESSYLPHIAPYVAGAAPMRFTALLGPTGIRIPYSEASEEPMFYQTLVTSRSILTPAAQFTYRFPRDRDGTDSLAGSLVDLWTSPDDPENERLADALDRLERAVSADMDLVTGIVTVRTRARWPDLAEQINRRILEGVQEFIFLKRSERYEAVHAFADDRTHVAAQELASAERALLDFHMRNRAFGSSPRLQLEERRLGDEMQRRLDVHTSLLLAEEETSVERLRDTPFITVIESPEKGAERTGPRLPIMIPVGLFVGGLLGMVTAAAVDRAGGRRVFSAQSP